MRSYHSFIRRAALCAALLLVSVLPLSAGIMDTLKQTVMPGSQSTGTQAAQSGLSTGDITQGLKEALRTTVGNSVSFLGKDGGFLNTPSVRIPMPQHLQAGEKIARSLGQDALADNFIQTMNSAAEQATKETASIFYNAISEMSFDDARAILNGPKDAATRYFQRTTTDDLTTRIRPIVEKSTEKTNVTGAYKNYAGKLKSLSPLMDASAMDLDGYVTEKTIHGIFTIMAEEEAKIRTNPAARTSDILKKVFGSASQ